jgi:DNA-binding NarL/FixJ family response regulator
VSAPTVLIADDHPLIRVGVRGALQRGGWIVCAEATDAVGAVEAAVREQPDACLLDIRMPGSGIEAAAEIARRVPRTAIVMLTVSRDDGDLLDALRAGAVGSLLRRRGESLTEQEWEVVELMSEGFTTFQIADRLFIEPAAVRARVASILEKLQVPSGRAALRLLSR